ncbi:hypothetical protein N5C72_18580 [Achromobacter mucicolens]|uniref:Uncharacterized protein n=1 Tax=Achromobacter mucicolens TaxID=1389922 RepID=A0ABD4YY69_9BURK|nr:hypothetical protein [Achromobacter mucicolens]MDH1180096.1 hypothetical protein [Achromobacter mucicolens]
MISSDLITFGLNWLAENSLAVVILLYALAPVLALVVSAYAVYVLAKAVRGKK